MRANFLTAALFFALLSSIQARAISPRQDLDSLDNDDGAVGDSAGVVDCSLYPEDCGLTDQEDATPPPPARRPPPAAASRGGQHQGLVGGLLNGLLGPLLGGLGL